jgi:DNA-binding transcriptional ArsR family regulator
MDKNEALDAFGALGQETRLDVFRLLVKAGPGGLPAGEIGVLLGVRQNTMSANLAVLARSRLVSRRRHGRVIRYSADIEGIRDLLAYLMEDCCGGRQEICQPELDKIVCDRETFDG